MNLGLYTFWSLWDEYNIVFPIIQRDYAQGRLSPHATEVRKKFLDDIYEALVKKKPMTLDFVYGTIKDDGKRKSFIPLDGQQRLTTLFLLHWYIFYRNEKNIILYNSSNNKIFSYETRDSSKDFCEYLASKYLSYKEQKELTISEYIIDQNWFQSVWLEDPTVKGMLVMIDAIEKKFKDENFNDLYEGLTNGKLISFFMLPLDEQFSLADDLYIKMNARGLALTTFENFKASLFQLLKEDDFIIEIDDNRRNDFFKKIDMEWTNIFWHTASEKTGENEKKEKKLKGNVDSEMMRFIRMILSFNYALEKKDDDFNSQNFNRMLVNAKRNVAIPEDQLSFYKLKEMGTLTPKAIKMLIQSFESIDVLFDKEGLWKNNIDKDYIDIEKEWRDFVQSKSPDYYNQLIIYAIILSLQKDNGLYTDDCSDIINDNIKEWLRLVRNIIRNTITDNQEKMRSAIIGITNLYDSFCKKKNDLSQLTKEDFGHFKEQGGEEIEKYNLMKKQPNIKENIIKFENCTYLEGQIKCLLNWAKKNNSVFDYKKFKELGDQLLVLFDKQEKEHYIERILLTNKLKGSYVYPYQFENYNIPKYYQDNYEGGIFKNVKNIPQFSFFNLKKDRDYSWRRLLNDNPEDYSSDTRKKSLTDCQQLFKEILENKLEPETTVDNDTNSIPCNWRELLSKNYPNWLGSYHTMYKVKINNKDEIYLSEGGVGKFFNKRSKTKKMADIK